MNPALDLKRIANLLRYDALKMVQSAGAGHVAGPMSSADVIATLYFSRMIDLKKDKVVLSCGHYCPVVYSALARKGYFATKELQNYMKLDSILPGHPEKGVTPGIEVSSGPLGQGVSVAVGMALALKMRHAHLSHKDTPRVYCILSDGEIQEGQVWEAFNFCVRRQLDNLIFILDRNRVQIENYVSQLASYGEIVGRFEAFGLYTIEINGNEPSEVMHGLKLAQSNAGSPTMIVANTVAGKGVSFMENDPEWHDKVPTQSEMEQAIKELGVSL